MNARLLFIFLAAGYKGLLQKKNRKIQNKNPFCCSTNDGLVVKSELRFSWNGNGGPSIGLVEGFHCGINLRRQQTARAGLTLSCCVSQSLAVTQLAVSTPSDAPTSTGRLSDNMNLFCFSLVRDVLWFLRLLNKLCKYVFGNILCIYWGMCAMLLSHVWLFQTV